MAARIGVVTFPGSLDDADAARAVRLGGAQPVELWHGSDDLQGVDAVILPGGFSYGDYLRAGAIASLSTVMRSVSAAAAKGLPVLGICNGFQVLCEAHLLPGTLMRNEQRRFHCSVQELVVESVDTVWTCDFATGDHINIAAKHGEGNYVADEATLAAIEANNQVVFRYVDNPNGSDHDIAGVTNEAGNVVGLMPHPEHSVEALTGGSTDGLTFISSVLKFLSVQV
ncbi:MAG: phosphoribosylformylglycinamidine synthase subunit PurQ [Acidipropionibacterium acidipropionici]|jgi:phosphoribosylformylglycinamidine synthase|uniref:Phosphoribosylformylglycinamidine synthase subunit PurQ n=2 Tax=Acidipropionibacterium acidipropionici TaxID=1748 RepID=A0A142KGG7_9ACTN|nr:phosphoribosylformylglycinamidine synthase subunit PurQ [Acidipropionibacterium acidipropionici]AFV90494.1 Phosphoribosylformylglycinamidine synthase 1 [Acidipropionibacterium acidipropionici ATCC 4875]ALN15288.1 phosphoribosylformylglycinamidine synthase [Acidipropionibacterium acidipropionici]AMS05205.1 phosphoribosylformylglycinamidine synthase [Acidipropionibacterium acidipropionici]AOZ46684.1 phosphoribosylformylglycinamidine synthase I [Acidipropionibacterium acidipropionici]APZ08963.